MVILFTINLVSAVGGTVASIVVVEVAARASGASKVFVPNSMVVLSFYSTTVLGDDLVHTGVAGLGARAIGHASRHV